MIDSESLLLVSILLPAVWAIPLVWIPSSYRTAQLSYALLGTLATLGLQLAVATRFETSVTVPQFVVDVPWIETWNIHFAIGVDGLSLPLMLLTGLVFVLSLLSSWSIRENLRGYLILYLLLETGVLGVFGALDLFLFYVFWEVMLLPMYFLIGLWGGPRREYAAIKFFLYTFAGGGLLLIAMLMFYFASEGSFDLLELARIGQGHDPGRSFSPQFQIIAFVLLLIGFGVKLPIVPLHTWLPEAHVEAPTPVSMILAGVLLKLAGYGLLRVAIPLCPIGLQWVAWPMAALGVLAIFYGALAALAQTDLKRLVAYSSISHMGYVLLGLAVWRINAATGETVGRDYWEMGLNAAMFQMVAHGISATGMFFLVGVLYDRVHHRQIDQFGNIAGVMPEFTGISIGLFFASLGLPGLCGFIGEVFAVIATWNYSPLMAVISAGGVILTAGYLLWTLQRVYLGRAYIGPNAEYLVPMGWRETVVGYTLLALAIGLGIYPPLVLGLTGPTLHQLVHNLDQSSQLQHARATLETPVTVAAPVAPPAAAATPVAAPAPAPANEADPAPAIEAGEQAAGPRGETP